MVKDKVVIPLDPIFLFLEDNDYVANHFQAKVEFIYCLEENVWLSAEDMMHFFNHNIQM